MKETLTKIKRNWFWILFGLSVAIIAIASTYLALSREDRGFLIRECEGKQVALTWRKSDFPLVVVSELQSPWDKPLQESIDFWNDHLDLFVDQPLQVDDVSKAKDPVVTVKFGKDLCTDELGNLNTATGCHASSQLKWDSACNIRRVIITLPPDVPIDTRRKVITHELGHALGLDHDDFGDSVMYPKVLSWGMIEVTAEDLSLLKDTYL